MRVKELFLYLIQTISYGNRTVDMKTISVAINVLLKTTINFPWMVGKENLKIEKKENLEEAKR